MLCIRCLGPSRLLNPATFPYAHLHPPRTAQRCSRPPSPHRPLSLGRSRSFRVEKKPRPSVALFPRAGSACCALKPPCPTQPASVRIRNKSGWIYQAGPREQGWLCSSPHSRSDGLWWRVLRVLLHVRLRSMVWTAWEGGGGSEWVVRKVHLGSVRIRSARSGAACSRWCET